jgi:predicted porin
MTGSQALDRSTPTRYLHNLYGLYALQKNADIRVDVIYDRQKLDEWTWNTFRYSDNTTVSLRPNQNVTFVGVRYVYRFK